MISQPAAATGTITTSAAVMLSTASRAPTIAPEMA